LIINYLGVQHENNYFFTIFKSPSLRIRQITAQEYNSTDATAAHEEPGFLFTEQSTARALSRINTDQRVLDSDDSGHGRRL
jgi:hypothetical protein